MSTRRDAVVGSLQKVAQDAMDTVAGYRGDVPSFGPVAAFLVIQVLAAGFKAVVVALYDRNEK